MLIIKVWCLPQVGEEKLREVHQSIVQAVVSIKELGLTSEKDMTTLFPTDMMQYGLGTEIIVEVSAILVKPNGGEDLRYQLAESLSQAVRQHFPDACIGCIVNSCVDTYAIWRSGSPR